MNKYYSGDKVIVDGKTPMTVIGVFKNFAQNFGYLLSSYNKKNNSIIYTEDRLSFYSEGEKKKLRFKK